MIDYRIITAPTMRGLDELGKRADRATMWATRESGRDVKRRARREAPVYRGARADIAPGLLRDSIRPSRRLAHVGAAWVLKIGPRGARVHLYAGKVERVHPFMRPAFDYARGRAKTTYERGWNRAMKAK